MVTQLKMYDNINEQSALGNLLLNLVSIVLLSLVVYFGAWWVLVYTEIALPVFYSKPWEDASQALHSMEVGIWISLATLSGVMYSKHIGGEKGRLKMRVYGLLGIIMFVIFFWRLFTLNL